ncbi:hypothetical protein ABC347_09800 [Sphingomonas sp. 1P06PA]|uniref:Gldg family protein n=1 Tax=Sphingomonas sp. 1P06PA TaxID=554121 RepID=UPI0039A61F65
MPAAPPIAVLTGLPLFWPEGGIGETLAGPPIDDSWRAALGGRAAIPIETSAGPALAGQRLLLAAQPRDQSPADLVALDDWVRRGGRLLWLADPALARASRLPLGHPGRPPASPTMLPLLARWHVSITPDRATGEGCMTAWDGLAADCRLGRGRAIIVADADLLFTPAGTARLAYAIESLAADTPLSNDSLPFVPNVLLLFLGGGLAVACALIWRRLRRP